MEHAWGKAFALGKSHARGCSWVGLICACSAAATCVWSAYSLCHSHFDCLCREWPDLTHMEHAWGKVHARGRRCSNGLTTSGESVGWRLQAGDKSLQWFIHAGRSIWWTIRKWVKQPYTRIYMSESFFFCCHLAKLRVVETHVVHMSPLLSSTSPCMLVKYIF